MRIIDRNNLVEEHLSWADNLINNFLAKLPSNVDSDNIRGAAYEDLVLLASRYRLEKGASFKTFARYRLMGSMIDVLREEDYLSKSARRDIKKFEKAKHQLLQKLRRDPTSEEIAEYVGMGIEEYYKKMLNIKSFFSIDQSDNDENNRRPFQIAAVMANNLYNYLENVEKKILSSQIINLLSGKQREVIYLYYLENLTMKQIAKKLSLTESRISQIHKGAVEFMRNKATNAST